MIERFKRWLAEYNLNNLMTYDPDNPRARTSLTEQEWSTAGNLTRYLAGKNPFKS